MCQVTLIWANRLLLSQEKGVLICQQKEEIIMAATIKIETPLLKELGAEIITMAWILKSVKMDYHSDKSLVVTKFNRVH
jgi:hypothetical protein